MRKKKVILLTLLSGLSTTGLTANDTGYLGSMGESRRALQESQREINQLIEQNRYQQLQENALEVSPSPHTYY
ncbi:hemolysin transporter protein ShlB [Proteus penneri ATCC 35198]|nr:hemolysin transporter protein ShlB [Proteus penneri ATCC 35198]